MLSGKGCIFVMKVGPNFYQNSLTESFECFEIVVPTISFVYIITYFENELILIAYYFEINPQVTEI